MTRKKLPDFEQSLQELEKLVEQLEKGDVPLEEALRRFERGIELTRHCQQALAEAEQRVQILLEQGGQQTLAPFDTAADD